eukprot:g31568.t1
MSGYGHPSTPKKTIFLHCMPTSSCRGKRGRLGVRMSPGGSRASTGMKKQGQMVLPRSSRSSVDQLTYANHHQSVDKNLNWVDFRLVFKKDVEVNTLANYQSGPLERSLLLYSSARCGGERMAKVLKKLCLLIFKEIQAYLNNDVLIMPGQQQARPSVYTPAPALPHSSPSSSSSSSSSSASKSGDGAPPSSGATPDKFFARGKPQYSGNSLPIPGAENAVKSPRDQHSRDSFQASAAAREVREVRAHNLCFDILNMGAHEALLRDEILCQLMKQTTNNPDKGSTVRGWKLIYLSLSAFPPSEELTPYVRAYITRHAPAKAEGNYGVDEVEHLALRSQIALGFGGDFALPRMMKTAKAPTFRRIKAVGSGNIRPLSFGEIYAPSRIAVESPQKEDTAEDARVQDSYGYTDIHTGIHTAQLAGAPFQSFAIRSKKGFIPKLEKPNQDRAVWRGDLGGNPNNLLFGVFDGHGSEGHKISSWLIDHLPKRFDEVWRDRGVQNNPGPIAIDLIPKINQEMLDTSDIDASYSGSTGVMCCISGKKLYTFNTGDSRAIMGRRVGQGKKPEMHILAKDGERKALEGALDYDFKAIEITRDHKPTDPEEKICIEAA